MSVKGEDLFSGEITAANNNPSIIVDVESMTVLDGRPSLMMNGIHFDFY